MEISSLVSTAALAYSLGLRHAFDADHISVRRTYLFAWDQEIKISAGYRFDDKKTSGDGAKACDRGNILLAGTFNVRLPSDLRDPRPNTCQNCDHHIYCRGGDRCSRVLALRQI